MKSSGVKWEENPFRNFQAIVDISTTNEIFFTFFSFSVFVKKNGDHTVKGFLMDGCNLQHHVQKLKNEKITVEF